LTCKKEERGLKQSPLFVHFALDALAADVSNIVVARQFEGFVGVQIHPKVLVADTPTLAPFQGNISGVYAVNTDILHSTSSVPFFIFQALIRSRAASGKVISPNSL
jgi:hypothetical protein